MTPAERRLATLVGGVVFLLLNIFIWSWVLGAIGRAHAELAARQAIRKEEAVFFKKSASLWAKRRAMAAAASTRL